MAKNRNTFAKRQREVDKKRKANDKRERRANKNQGLDDLCEPDPSVLSAGEYTVLGIFRKYTMTPGKMLCLTGADLEVFNVPIGQLMDRGLLVEEKDQGGYSLTEVGFEAMNDGEKATNEL